MGDWGTGGLGDWETEFALMGVLLGIIEITMLDRLILRSSTCQNLEEWMHQIDREPS